MARRRPTLTCGPSLTKQSHVAECDVNNIIEAFDRDGVITHLRRDQPNYLDVSQVGSYREALDQVREANTSFYQLPSALRAEFNNDPALYVDFMATASPEAIDAVLRPEAAPDVSTSTPEPPEAPEAIPAS